MIFGLSGVPRMQAAIITVGSALDNVTGSLRTTIVAASAGDTISFNALITDNVPILLTGGEITIDKSLVIMGNGMLQTAIVGSSNRIFNISNAGAVELHNLTLIDGSATGYGGAIISANTKLSLSNCAILSSDASISGGAIYNSGDTLSLDNCHIYNNTASGNAATEGGGGICNVGGYVMVSNNSIIRGNAATGTSGSGGGILSIMGGNVMVANSRIVSNSSVRAGGGIEGNSGAGTMITLTNVVLDSNMTSMAPGNGGGLHITGPVDVNITGGTASHNWASAEGGGLWNGAGTMNVSGVMIESNTASGASADQGGGGIYNLSGTVNVSNSTVIRGNMANGASGSGGGILNDAGATLNVMNSWIVSNSSMRAGGGIEDVSGSATTVVLTNVVLDSNVTSMAPGNGGGLHITGPGNVNITGGSASHNWASAEGGALWNGAGTMNVSGVMIESNTASGALSNQGGGGIYNLSGTVNVSNNTVIRGNIADGAAGSGGGILNDSSATLTVANSQIIANSSMRAGGGIEDNSRAGTLVTLTNVVLDSNITSMAPGNGGGLHVTGNGDVSIVGGSASHNWASAEGGGLWNGAGIMAVNGVMIENNTASGAGADQGGGGIYNLSGTVNVTNSTVIRGNTADGAAGSGGGILNDVGATLNVTDSWIMSNTSMRAGGGIEDNSRAGTTVTLTNVVLDSNVTSMAPGNGGGLHVTGNGDVNITGGSASHNWASAEGGGLWNGAGIMAVSGVMIENNTASGAAADQGGGGIYNLSGTVNVSNSTVIRGNTADGTAGSGGGILNDVGATLTVADSWIVSNSSMRAGGGIEDVSGAATTVVLTNVKLDSNMTSMAPGNGGGLHVTGDGAVNITGGTANYNWASAEGGALWNGAGTMNVSGVWIENNTASGASADQGGGGIYNLSGTVNVSNSTVIRGNTADGASGSGGGILNDAGATLNVMDSWVVANSSMRAGGGIEDNSGAGTMVTLTNVVMDSNMTSMSPGNGGAFHITGAGDAMITGGSVRYNTAGNQGGGLWNGSGLMIVDGVSIELNSVSGDAATSGGGGVYNKGGEIEIMASTIAENACSGMNATGGGIFNTGTGTVEISYSTISGNTVMEHGGGISTEGMVSLKSVTLVYNSAGNMGGGIILTTAMAEAALSSSIVASNNASSGVDLGASMGTYTSAGYNLVGQDDASVFAPESTDWEGTSQSPIDPMVEPLADNGGDTRTHALKGTSPAIDMGDPMDMANDQRDSTVFNGRRDIGAYESQSPATSIDVEKEATISQVYPNPVTQKVFSINLQTATGSPASAQILDLATGKTLMETPASNKVKISSR
ncbi:MAG: choice-of-anchor Q domain-containing protein [Bacteroidia bacterium]